jgi:hypothetical protein
LYLVEGSTPSKKEKETVGRVGAGKVEASAPNDREREDCIRVPLGMIALKEGAVVVVGTAEKKKNPELQEDVTSRALGRQGTVIHC